MGIWKESLALATNGPLFCWGLPQGFQLYCFGRASTLHGCKMGWTKSRWLCKLGQWEIFCKEKCFLGKVLPCDVMISIHFACQDIELHVWKNEILPTAKSQVSAITPAAQRRALQCLGACWGLLHFGICIILVVVSPPFNHHHHYHHSLGGLL